MLHFFRTFFQSKYGVAFTMAFLVLIALAFGLSDITGNSSNLGSVSAGDAVAVVGERKVTANDLSTALNAELESRRQQEPTLTMQALLARGGANTVLDRLMQRLALSEWGENNGLRAGKRLVDSELVKIPAFQGPDGKFSREAFDAVLQQQRLSEAGVRDDIAAGLLAQQILAPVDHGVVAPTTLAKQYAVLLRERRKGAILTLPSVAFAPKGDPTEAQLAAYHKANSTDYIRPERRVLRYATFGEDAIGTIAAPTDAQIAARFEQDKAQYAARETRTFTQMVAPTEAAAKTIVDEVSGGNSMAASAREKGLSTVSVGPVSKTQFAGQSSQAVADAAFAAAEGTIVAPKRGNLGWYVLKVDQVTRTPARSLDEVKGEIAKTSRCRAASRRLHRHGDPDRG